MIAVDALESIGVHNQLRLQFLTALRRRWSTEVFAQLRAEYCVAINAGHSAKTREEAAALIERCPTYPWFSWLERGGQKLKWRVITDIVAMEWSRLGAQFDSEQPSRVKLDPDLPLPNWYTAWDIHCQPGGVWGDISSALVYELGTKVLHLGRNDKFEMHRLFTETAVPNRKYRRIVDLGCGFGKSTIPFKERFPDAEVIGIDLSGPCVTLGATRSAQAGVDVSFRQANAANTYLEPESAGLVTGTMVLHEMPIPALRDLFLEVARILEPGGLCRFLEFSRMGDLFRDAVMNHHAVRNNEPFMQGLMDLDVRRELAAAGLVGGHWVPFDERGAGIVAEYPARDEWHFPWAVLVAEKPVHQRVVQ